MLWEWEIYFGLWSASAAAPFAVAMRKNVHEKRKQLPQFITVIQWIKNYCYDSLKWNGTGTDTSHEEICLRIGHFCYQQILWRHKSCVVFFAHLPVLQSILFFFFNLQSPWQNFSHKRHQSERKDQEDEGRVLKYSKKGKWGTVYHTGRGRKETSARQNALRNQHNRPWLWER